jgi:hypothetical protein
VNSPLIDRYPIAVPASDVIFPSPSTATALPPAGYVAGIAESAVVPGVSNRGRWSSIATPAFVFNAPSAL